ncbi:protein of unknown function DUF1486 [Shewanella denitrificans OS217]|uniref:HTH luxR-type domain-containing protein n=1 Tax=Shewanella denitrificans (strain OS217 / ATCC BAA-1090 / DSM 15013) TaxID=318161 RepID=Q12SH6_SHEDO|nr:ester cyclase [Shewanella denitrificans]ABE53600.1 protein of unknown function DUF1486 [Shewanella denitrificans OS217]
MIIFTHRQTCIRKAQALMELTWNDKTSDHIKDMMTQNTTIESPIKLSVGYESFCDTLKLWYRAFPTLSYTENSVATHNGEVIIEWTAKGRQLGEFLDISATGRPIIYSGITNFVFMQDKVIRYSSKVHIQSIISQLIGTSFDARFGQQESNSTEKLFDVIQQLLSTKLTRRQVECLSLSTLNISVKEIASLLTIESSSVQTHLKRAFDLLQISNKKMFMAYITANNTIEVFIRMGLFLRKKN